MSKRILYLGLDPAHYHSEGSVTHWPIIQIVPRPLTDISIQQALVAFEQYTHIIVTAKSTVAILRDYLPRLGIPLQTWMAKKTLAVGQATAKHLIASGIIPIKTAKEETAEGMIQELKQLSLEQAHCFWPHSSKARSVIEDFFVANMIRYTVCILYEPRPHVPGNLPSLDHYDEIVFTSPSTVDAFLEIFGQFPSQACLTSIGPITAQHLEMRLLNTQNKF